MKKHKKLTVANRATIVTLLQENFTIKHIAMRIGSDKSTICREIKTRSTPNGYFANIAQIDYEQKRQSCRKDKILANSKNRNYVLEKLTAGWSPEQIAGRQREVVKSFKISHETIYRFIYEDEYCKSEKIYQYLRRGRKKRKKKNGRKVHKTKIPNRVSIHKRPMGVKEHNQFGHWEGDSVIYANKKAINTLNELKTGMVVFTKLEQKTAQLTVKAMKTTFNAYPRKDINVR